MGSISVWCQVAEIVQGVRHLFRLRAAALLGLRDAVGAFAGHLGPLRELHRITNHTTKPPQHRPASSKKMAIPANDGNGRNEPVGGSIRFPSHQPTNGISETKQAINATGT